MAKQTYVLEGSITAETPLAVSRPGDNFKYGAHSEKLQRLPRSGPKHPNTDVYFPASSINGALRRCAVALVRRAAAKELGSDTPFDIDTHYCLTQGVDTAKKLSAESGKGGLIEEELDLRSTNPLLSLLGRWGLPGHLGMGDAFINKERSPETVMYITGNGARVNDWQRNSQSVQFLSAEDRERLKRILIDDSAAAKDINVMKDQVTELKKNLRSAKGDKAAASKIKEEMSQLEAQILESKAAKAGSEESIQRTLDGYEVIAPGVVMNQKTVLTNVTQIELGLFIHALAEFSREPRVGAHFRQGAGLISGKWEVNIRPVGSWKKQAIGEISMSFDEFAITDYDDDKTLSAAADAATSALANLGEHGIDFARATKIA